MTGTIERAAMTSSIVVFVAWCLREFLERKCGMYPKIIESKSILNSNSEESKASKNYIIKRLTRQLDLTGKYRIQSSASVHYVKTCWKFGLVGMMLAEFYLNPNWFYYYLISMKPHLYTSNYEPLYHASAIIMTMYAWETVATNRYAKLNWSSIVHHWITVFAATSIIAGYYNPCAVWYGITGVMLVFPENFALGFRASHCRKYPMFTKKMFIFVYWWYLIISILNIFGQIYLIIFGKFVYQTLSYYTVAYVIVSICAWIYSDYQLLKHLKEFANMDYHLFSLTKEAVNDDDAANDQKELESQVNPNSVVIE